MRILTEIYSEKIAHISQNTPVIINGLPVEAIFTTELSSPLSRNETLCGEPAIEEPAGCEKLDEKPAEHEHPVTYGDLVDEWHPLGKFLVKSKFLFPKRNHVKKARNLLLNVVLGILLPNMMRLSPVNILLLANRVLLEVLFCLT